MFNREKNAAAFTPAKQELSSRQFQNGTQDPVYSILGKKKKAGEGGGGQGRRFLANSRYCSRPGNRRCHILQEKVEKEQEKHGLQQRSQLPERRVLAKTIMLQSVYRDQIRFCLVVAAVIVGISRKT